MISKLFPSRGKASAARLPRGRRLYVIGDIHGTLDLLNDILVRIEDDLTARPQQGTTGLVFLGDYIDRGPCSAGVVAHLAEFHSRRFDLTFLKGNHEDMALRFVDDPVANWPRWANCGGRETLISYRIEPPGVDAGKKALQSVAAKLAGTMPDPVLAWLRALKLTHQEGDYLFVHAGLRPDVELEAQAEQDLLWIRGEFLNHGKSFGPIIVHGHTPRPEPEVKSNRIGIDTMAFSTGILTALVLEGSRRAVLQSYSKGIRPL